MSQGVRQGHLHAGLELRALHGPDVYRAWQDLDLSGCVRLHGTCAAAWSSLHRLTSLSLAACAEWEDQGLALLADALGAPRRPAGHQAHGQGATHGSGQQGRAAGSSSRGATGPGTSSDSMQGAAQGSSMLARIDLSGCASLSDEGAAELRRVTSLTSTRCSCMRMHARTFVVEALAARACQHAHAKLPFNKKPRAACMRGSHPHDPILRMSGCSGAHVYY